MISCGSPMEPGSPLSLEVDVVCAWPRRHALVRVAVPEGSTVASAVAMSGLPLEEIVAYAIFGERVAADVRVRDGDRIELLRRLQLDPKDARRRRAAPK